MPETGTRTVYSASEKSTPFCVIGDPIEHSPSPVMHNRLFDMQKLPYTYEAVHVRPEELSGFIREAKERRRPGFNVTLPHKETVVRYLDRLDTVAERIGAVNTVRYECGRLTGYNTDVQGFSRAVEAIGWLPGKVILMGAGGAARAAVEALAGLGVKTLIILNRNPERAERLGEEARKWHPVDVITGDLDPLNRSRFMEGVSLVINATPCGMSPRTEGTPFPEIDWIPEHAVVFDMVPNPLETRLLREAKARKLKTLSGLPMLVEQEVAAQEIWLGRTFQEKERERMVRDVSGLVSLRFRSTEGD